MDGRMKGRLEIRINERRKDGCIEGRREERVDG